MSTRSLLVSPAVLAGLFTALVSACGGENTKLMVTGIEPDKGDVQGDSYVVVKGNRFLDDGPRTAKIFFGGRRGNVIRFASDREMVVQPPGGKAGDAVDVVIEFDPGGTLKIPNGFHYVERRQGPSVDDLNINRKDKN